MTLDRRLNRLQLVYRRREPPPGPGTSFDPQRLSFAEQIELDDLLRPLAPLPGERWDLDSLTDEQLERAAELTRKAEGLPPSPAFRYMRHRDPGIGPCLCAACLATAPASPGEGVA